MGLNPAPHEFLVAANRLDRRFFLIIKFAEYRFRCSKTGANPVPSTA
jgi:hypothetical protein